MECERGAICASHAILGALEQRLPGAERMIQQSTRRSGHGRHPRSRYPGADRRRNLENGYQHYRLRAQDRCRPRGDRQGRTPSVAPKVHRYHRGASPNATPAVTTKADLVRSSWRRRGGLAGLVGGASVPKSRLKRFRQAIERDGKILPRGQGDQGRFREARGRRARHWLADPGRGSPVPDAPHRSSCRGALP